MTDRDDYALRSLQLGRMTGVALGVHAVSDAFLLQHAGVGCKFKATLQIAQHDWERHPNRHEGWTEVSDAALIRGSAGRIGPYARSWAERRRPGVMVMVASSFLEMTGEDFGEAARRAGAALDCPLLVVPGGGFDGDLYQGYADLLLALARLAPWSGRERRAGEVGLVGHFFDRYEGDQLGNLQQLRVLLEGIGLRLGPVWASGRPHDELLALPGCPVLLRMPYARPVARALETVCGRPLPDLDLPVGLAGTARWLRRIADEAGVPPARVDRFLDRQLEYARPRLAKVADRLGGARMAVFADTPLAAGLCSLLIEIGVEPALVGLRSASLGGRDELLAAIERDGLRRPVDCEILEHPTLRRARARLFAVLGDLPMPGRPVGFFGLEVGFPSVRTHVTHASPWMGFGGAVVLAQRILNAFVSGVRPPRQ
jgi:nitrogenase molybdenum-iron protein alpha/beta subunit